ncbi:precorrin-3B C(17)-methyltransferase [Xanthobacter autotrophicus]|uniref:precorrin-3B C(17)-methyltransferase n=1 Tax=Xanthobacter autotrophicus TaxID=280 RepID=UPI003729E25B
MNTGDRVGRLTVVGLGPGAARQMTPEAAAAVEAADLVFGYAPYLARLPERPGQERRPSDNREEIARASAALDAAVAGARVAMVSGGDPGVFAMAAAVCEAIEHGPDAWRALDFEVVPGVTAMLAVAARCGAPLGHDFCALSLSDNLKPWALVERRLLLAAEAGFVIALYNPISRARPWQLGRAFEILRERLAGNVPVVFGRAAGREDERIALTTLAEADPAQADMATCVIIGTADTRIVPRPGLPPLVYAPRAADRPAPRAGEDYAPGEGEGSASCAEESAP